MSKRFLILIILLLATNGLAACTDNSLDRLSGSTDEGSFVDLKDGNVEHGIVDSVIDGTRIKVEINGKVHSVRYIGVNVPKLQSTNAAQFNRILVDRKAVTLEPESVRASGSGELLRYVYVNGQMVNEALVMQGYGVVSNTPDSFRLKPELLAAESVARSEKRGVWGSLSEIKSPENPVSAGESPTKITDFAGGTLPSNPQSTGEFTCDYSKSADSVIKGIIDTFSGERIYYVPDDLAYENIEVDQSQGGQWFCNEETAISLGWRRPTG